MPTEPDEPARINRDRELAAAIELADSILQIKLADSLGAYYVSFLYEVWRLWIDSGRDPFILENVKTMHDVCLWRCFIHYRRSKHDDPGGG